MYKLNWKPEHRDHRDKPYSELRKTNRFKAVLLPSSKYLHEDHFPSLFDQLWVGSCTGNGAAQCASYAVDVLHRREDGLRPEPFSRLFIYYNARGNKDEDEGAFIRDAVKSIAKYGVCYEQDWPYIPENWPVKPSEEAYRKAAHRAFSYKYFRLTSLNEIKDCIVQGFPVVFGMTVFDYFSSIGKSGICRMPFDHESPSGGHCMIIVGYSDKMQAFYVRNSWGFDWGKQGYCWVPYEYIQRLGSDFWTIRYVAE